MTRSLPLPLNREHDKLIARELHFIDRQDASAAPEDAGGQFAVALGHAQPSGPAAGNGECPMADVGIGRFRGQSSAGKQEQGGGENSEPIDDEATIHVGIPPK